MATAIQQVFTLCRQTFAKHSSADKLNKEILSPIISSLNKITHHDLRFDPEEFKDQVSKKINPAPVSYMELYRDHKFTMAVFVVRAGSSLPLHDHPDMFGLLKLIHGSIRLVSYNDATDSFSPALSESQRKNLKPVIKNSDKIVSSSDDCCVLTPTDGNIHGIQPLTEFSAFLDILVPSYRNNSCHYYQEVETTVNSNSKTKWLAEIPEPSTYWCDSLPYRGPKLI